MTVLENISIGRRLTIGFASILIIIAGLSAISVEKVRSINDDLTTINDVNSVKQRYAINFRGSVHNRAIALRDVTLVGADELNATITDIEKLSEDYAKSAAPLDGLMSSGTVDEEEQRILATIKETEFKTLPLIKLVIDRQKAGDFAGAHTALMTQARPQFNEWLRQINQFIDLEEKKNKEIGTSARQVADTFTVVTLALCAGAVLLGIGIAAWVIRSIRPLHLLTQVMGRMADGDFATSIPSADRRDEIGDIARAVQVFRQSGIERDRLQAQAGAFQAELDSKLKTTELAFEAASSGQKAVVAKMAEALARLAEGDLTVRVEASGDPAYATLLNDFNTAVGTLSSTMGDISEAAKTMTVSVAEISASSEDLSQRTERQAASLEETAAALDEITATLKKTSEGSTHARSIVATAKTNAEQSGDIVRRAVTAMSAIEQSAQQVSQIIGVIDEIAFQTNLLALNAGVEAARAGDAGRGFAVVASEVRALAQRSAEAAKEIKTLISASSQQVDEGVSLVGETGKALERIAAQVTEINVVVTEIAASTEEQSTALREVNTAINQMDQVTQQNAAMVEESTAASHSLNQETDVLAKLIGRFQIGQPVDVSKPVRKPRLVTQLKAVGRGGVMRKTEPARDGWQAF